MKKAIFTAVLCLFALQGFAQNEQKATVWGCKSDGITDNTGSIQRAIDTMSKKGGGTLVFYVGRYLTGAIQLKDNVTIRLEEAAVLVGSTNIYSYKGAPALVWSNEAKNAGVSGKGVVECRHAALRKSLDAQIAKGYLPSDTALPAAFSGVEVGDEIKILEDTAASTGYNR